MVFQTNGQWQRVAVCWAFITGLLLPSPFQNLSVGNGKASLVVSSHVDDELSASISENKVRQEAMDISNFGASVKAPDEQLNRHLNLDKIKNRVRHAPSRQELLENLYNIKDDGADFYDGFTFPTDRANRVTTGKYVSNFVRDHGNIFALIESLMPSSEGSINFIVEAGSFIGSSANMWAKLARKHNATVLCIDTWEGDINMWVLPAFAGFMSVTYGRSHLYENFIQNIIDGKSTDVILPMAVSSLVGAKVLWAQKFMVDVAYIDTAHEQGETLGEMFAYWELLRPGDRKSVV